MNDRGDDVVRVPTDVTAAQRARWLAELSDALEDAQRLLWSMPPSKLRTVDALDLSARLEDARAQVALMRLGRATELPTHSGPEWTSKPLWDRPIEDCNA
jgi:hypothetical protein